MSARSLHVGLVGCGGLWWVGGIGPVGCGGLRGPVRQWVVEGWWAVVH